MGVVDNAHRGELTIEIDGDAHVLRFTWDAIARLQEAFGERYDQALTKAFHAQNVEVVAQVVSIGTGGSVSPEQVREASPPLVHAIGACMDALHRAYYGADGPPTEDDSEGKRMTRSMWWQKVIGRRREPGSPQSSGI